MLRKIALLVVAVVASAHAHAEAPISVSMTSPANGAAYTAAATIDLRAQAIALEDGYSVSSVTFLSNGVAINTVSTSPYRFSWTDVPAGTYNLSARATDNTGDTITSTAVTVTVSAAGNQAPTVSLTNPENGSTYIASAAIELGASASDTDGSIEKVEFYKGTTLIGSDSTAPYAVTWNESVAGSYSVTAKAWDDSNGATVSAARTVTVYANSLPSVEITTPDNGTSYLAPASIPIKASASDSDGTIDRVEFRAAGTLIGTDYVAPYAATWDTGNVGGTYTVIATAVDDKGGRKSSSINVVLTSSAGSLSGTPNPCPFYDSGQTTCPMTISWSSNNTAAELWHTYLEYVDGDYFDREERLGVGENGSVLVQIDLIKDQQNRFRVKSNGEVVASMIPQHQWAPTAAITTPTANQVFQAPARITIDATASDQDGSVDKVEFYNGSTLLGTDYSSPYRYVWDNVGAGARTIRIKAYDNLDAVRGAAVSIVVNAQPTVSLTAPTDGDSYVVGETITLTASAADADDPISKVEFYNGTIKLGTATTSPYRYAWTGAAGSTTAYSLSAKVYDSRGGTGTSAVRKVTVNAKPTVILTAPVTGVAGATFPLSASAADLDDGVASVTFHADGQPLHTVSTAPYKFDWLDAEAGTYSIHASASDTRGATTSSDAVSVTLYSSEVKGDIEGRQDKTIVGWACSTHLDSAIDVHLYLGDAVGADTHAGAYRADQSSEPAIASACQAAGSAYRFRIPITESMLADHGGKTIHVLGISPVGGSSSVLARSGVFSLPMAPITDPNAVTRRYVYDQHQQLCKVIEPETGSTVMSYDGAGNLAWSAAGLVLPDASATSCAPDRVTAHASGRRVDRSYDARNRLDMLSFPDGNGNQAWRYTPDGLPDQITTYNDAGNTSVTNTYDYNNRRLLTGESQSQTGRAAWTLDYGYNANAHLLSHVYPDGLTIDYAPNALGQPTRAGSYASDVGYYPNGAIKQFTYGNGIVHSLIQNARGLPERSQDAYPGKAVLDDSYDYDRNGNVAAISDGLPGGRGDRDMSYDDLDRLTRASSPMFGSVDPLVLYEYDVLDNLRRVKADGQDRTYYYDSTNRLMNVLNTVHGDTVVGLDYDVQGNLKDRNNQAYSFDFGNRLRAVPNKEQYRYDGHGRRVMADHPIEGSIWSQYGQDGALRFQQDERAGRHADYIYLAGSLVAKRSTTAFASGTITTTYQHTDALGSPVAVTDESRAVVERSEYAPYGELLNRPLSNGPGYTGHVMDAATGLAYMQQRYYDPGVGRFLSVDPVTADANLGTNFNRYKYAANNPYRFTDPDGRRDWDSLGAHSSNFTSSGAGFRAGPPSMRDGDDQPRTSSVASGRATSAAAAPTAAPNADSESRAAGKVDLAGVAFGVADMAAGTGEAVAGLGLATVGILSGTDNGVSGIALSGFGLLTLYDGVINIQNSIDGGGRPSSFEQAGEALLGPHGAAIGKFGGMVPTPTNAFRGIRNIIKGAGTDKDTLDAMQGIHAAQSGDNP